MHFINESTISSADCDTLIDYFKNKKEEGRAFPGMCGDCEIDPKIKKSTDVHITQELHSFFSGLIQKSLDEYIERFPFCNYYSKWAILVDPLIQHYAPNDGFYAWHTERCGATKNQCNRHLVYMVYLNDVTDGGGTEFYHQNLVVQPVKGKVLIWPADWTYTHRGIPSPTQEKYIVTGWFEYME